MKTVAAAVVVIAMLASVTARAGVVMEEEETNSAAGAAGGKHNRTVMIEGHKQKVVTDKRSVVIDLDSGSMTLINPGEKTYFQMPFPPQGPMSQSMKSLISQHLDYQKAEGQRTVAGFKCQDYKSSGKLPTGEYSATSCFSSDAPGAAEFTAFQTALAAKVGSGSAGAAKIPEGVPLAIHTVTKMTGFSMPGIPPEQAKMMSQMMANRPPVVSDTTVTKIAAQKLGADTFAVPAGYTKREMPAMPGPGMGHAPMGGIH
jgi:hypothetical protein